jgi:hypothetical protein
VNGFAQARRKGNIQHPTFNIQRNSKIQSEKGVSKSDAKASHSKRFANEDVRLVGMMTCTTVLSIWKTARGYPSSPRGYDGTGARPTNGKRKHSTLNIQHPEKFQNSINKRGFQKRC